MTSANHSSYSIVEKEKKKNGAYDYVAHKVSVVRARVHNMSEFFASIAEKSVCVLEVFWKWGEKGIVSLALISHVNCDTLQLRYFRCQTLSYPVVLSLQNVIGSGMPWSIHLSEKNSMPKLFISHQFH